MRMPPAIFDLRVADSGKRPFRIWLPVFLLWPLAIVLFVLGFVVTILVDIVLVIFGQRFHGYTMFLLGCLDLLTETHGLTVYVRNENTYVDLTVR